MVHEDVVLAIVAVASFFGAAVVDSAAAVAARVIRAVDLAALGAEILAVAVRVVIGKYYFSPKITEKEKGHYST